MELPFGFGMGPTSNTESSGSNWANQNTTSAGQTASNTDTRNRIRNNQTQTYNTGPWGPMQQYLMSGAQNAAALFNAGVGGGVNTMSMVSPFAQQTQQGMGMMGDVSNGFAQQMQQPLTAYGTAMNAMLPMALGDFSNDPAFQQSLARSQRDIGERIDMQKAASGRYGGASHQRAVADALSGNRLNAELQRQQMGLGQLQSLGNNMAGGYNMALMPGQTQMGIGGMYEDLQNRFMQDQARIFEDYQRSPWEMQGLYQGAINPMAGMGQSGTVRSTGNQTERGNTDSMVRALSEMFSRSRGGSSSSSESGSNPGAAQWLGLIGSMFGG
jgi:hypothetical protein